MDLDQSLHIQKRQRQTGKNSFLQQLASQLTRGSQLPCSYIPGSGKVHVACSYRKLENSYICWFCLWPLKSWRLSDCSSLDSLSCIELMQLASQLDSQSLLLLNSLGRLSRQKCQITDQLSGKRCFIVTKSCPPGFEFLGALEVSINFQTSDIRL